MGSLLTMINLIKNEFFFEKKSSNNLFYMTFFSFSCLIIMFFALPPSKLEDVGVLSGFFWIIVSLVSIKLIENSFIREKEYGIYDIIYSLPSEKFLIFLSKTIAFSLILLGIEAFMLCGYILISSKITISIAIKILTVCFLSNIGLIGLGILIYLITSLSNSRSFLFPLILFPLIVPILVHSSNLFTLIVLEEKISLYNESCLLLVTFAIISMIFGINFFDRLVRY
tara:strand:- start:713 stop:1390 length:678 start_codon:yes stop_codon:yes gene_type:complete